MATAFVLVLLPRVLSAKGVQGTVTCRRLRRSWSCDKNALFHACPENNLIAERRRALVGEVQVQVQVQVIFLNKGPSSHQRSRQQARRQSTTWPPLLRRRRSARTTSSRSRPLATPGILPRPLAAARRDAHDAPNSRRGLSRNERRLARRASCPGGTVRRISGNQSIRSRWDRHVQPQPCLPCHSQTHSR